MFFALFLGQPGRAPVWERVEPEAPRAKAGKRLLGPSHVRLRRGTPPEERAGGLNIFREEFLGR